MNFLNYFEIFLNEIRKFDIACGEFEVPGGIPSINLRRQRQQNLKRNQLKLHQDESNRASQLSPSSPTSPSKKLSMVAEESSSPTKTNNLNVMNSNSPGGTVGGLQIPLSPSKIQSQSPSKLNLKMEGDIRLISSVEAIFVFSAVWGLGSTLKKSKRAAFHDFLLRCVDRYIKYRLEKTRVRYSMESYPFGMNLRALLRKHTRLSVFDLCYDVVQAKWVRWSSLSQEDFTGDISGDFENNLIDAKEIIRLNPHAIDFVASKIVKEKQNIYIPDNNLISVETLSSKITKFFMQFMIAYAKPSLFIAQYQNGLTHVTKSKMKQLMEQQSYMGVYISVSRGMGITEVFFGEIFLEGGGGGKK